ncbi:inositol monophosphatase [marine bacterium AO1-C]|nr:inositol monophosphatase [marine bacterium AO1-C]
MKQVIIASQNPVKVNASKEGMQQVFPNTKFNFEGINVASGVSDQPMSSQETYQGAFNRAVGAQQLKPEADYWIGIEGGIEEVQGHMEVFAWVVILGNQQQGVAKTASFMLPQKVSTLVKQGYELGAADDMVFRKKDSKKSSGSVGILTNGLIDRKEYYIQTVVLALIPFMHPDLYTQTRYNKDLLDQD